MRNENPREPCVLAGVDGSDASLSAVDWGAHVAAGTGRTLTVALVLPGPGADISVDVAEALTERGRRIIGRARTRAHAVEAGLRSRGLLLYGQPAAELRRFAAPDDVLAVASAGAGRFQHMLTGSTAAQLAAHAPCPVVVTRAAATRFQRPVVVGVDGVASSPVVEFAVQAAAREHAELLAVHAFTVPAAAVEAGGPGGGGDAVAAARMAAARLLDAAVGPWAEKFPELMLRREVVRGASARALVEASRRASLVVVGARGRGGFPELAVGSVAQHVLALAACPVAVVH